MILVELEAGSERAFGSLAELAEAVRMGMVDAGSRIYHRTSAQWLPITVHPVFRRAAAERRSEPLPPLARSRWTFFDAGARPPSVEEPVEAIPRPRPPDSPAGPLRRAFGRAMRYLRVGGVAPAQGRTSSTDADERRS